MLQDKMKIGWIISENVLYDSEHNRFDHFEMVSIKIDEWDENDPFFESEKRVDEKNAHDGIFDFSG